MISKGTFFILEAVSTKIQFVAFEVSIKVALLTDFFDTFLFCASEMFEDIAHDFEVIMRGPHDGLEDTLGVFFGRGRGWFTGGQLIVHLRGSGIKIFCKILRIVM